jgi:hypothetical protein
MRVEVAARRNQQTEWQAAAALVAAARARSLGVLQAVQDRLRPGLVQLTRAAAAGAQGI